MTTRKEQQEIMEKKKAVQTAKKEATFAKPTKKEMELINKGLSDDRKNLVQFLKSHYQNVFATKQARAFQERFEAAIEAGVEIKDNYGLVMSKKELELEAMKNYLDLRMMEGRHMQNMVQFKKVWKLDEKDVQKYFDKWFVKNENW